MTYFVQRNFVPASIALLMAIVIISAFPSWKNAYIGWTPAVVWGKVTVLTPVVRPGETLKVVYELKVNRQCPAELQRFILTSDGAAPIRFDPIPGGYTHASPDWVKIPVSVVVPLRSDAGQLNWSRGEYIYRSFATRYCPEGTEVDDKTPDVKFTMEVP